MYDGLFIILSVHSYYLHVVIDQFSKYPEVDILPSTSFAKFRPKLDQMFCRHGIPEPMTADNGPPYPSEDMRKYAEEHGFKMSLTTPENPQSNGFAEIFARVLCKLLHTASAEGKDPLKELTFCSTVQLRIRLWVNHRRKCSLVEESEQNSLSCSQQKTLRKQRLSEKVMTSGKWSKNSNSIADTEQRARE